MEKGFLASLGQIKISSNSQFHAYFKHYFTWVIAEAFPHSFQFVLATWNDMTTGVNTFNNLDVYMIACILVLDFYMVKIAYCIYTIWTFL